MKGSGRLLLVLAVVLAVLPVVVTPYRLDLLSTALVFGMFALSIDLLWGYAGILNLGPAAFFGLGAYVFALAVRHISPGTGSLLGLALATLVPPILAAIIGYAGFRRGVSQVFYALIAMAVALVMEKIPLVLPDLTGGSNGFTGVSRPDWTQGGAGLSLTDNIAYYYLVAIVALLVLWFCTRVVTSPFGRVLRAIRSNELKVLSLGYNTIKYKIIVTVLAAAIGGIAGALFTPIAGIAYPGMFSVALSMQGFVWVAVGGQGTLFGPFFAAVALKLVESFLSGMFSTVYLMILGLLFVVVVKLFPAGIGGFVSRRLKGWAPAGKEVERG